jgi:hypothetical protein
MTGGQVRRPRQAQVRRAYTAEGRPEGWDVVVGRRFVGRFARRDLARQARDAYLVNPDQPTQPEPTQPEPTQPDAMVVAAIRELVTAVWALVKAWERQ